MEDTRAKETRTAVIVPVISGRAARRVGDAGGRAVGEQRSLGARREEAVGLAAAISLDVVFVELLTLQAPRPATLLGVGKVEEIAHRVADQDVELVVVDHELTPIQQRNLERALKAKVVDRTGLILEIFGRRAQTREGTLQVDLAHLSYQKSRLVRSWTHLERQRGGKGFLGGPGETQIESDRRVIQEKITRLKGQLEEVRRTRTLHRSRRQDVPAPTVALVGYTNAGKSTLFNRIVDEKVMAKDLLFATLDPTLRKVELPKGTEVILSDTVGFISNLPTSLIAAFRATLEEVLEADLIVHVRDITHPETEAQRADVLDVLTQLGVVDRDGQSDRAIIEAWNKIDLMDADSLAVTRRQADVQGERVLAVSAVGGQGLDALLAQIEEEITATRQEETFHIPVQDGEGRAWVFANATVLDETVLDDGSTKIRVAMTPRRMAHARARFGVAAAAE
ncbi:MAG: GTPase HflX [Rhizobiales bacterium]|nr:GTPase HflX [Hyphomicrobiales bacterium]MBO6698057.1 GTPase HflX [Hyphomicrobiales bacterium]MBO6735689.1 GTPase HflX [Hyphomicrobiales bacterium]MBO6910503.1 GTPase HflX [Hyphomicrobiales bacterium]MBO6956146.1 GTPase HflX [Hyphomicrobiales bacterium]